MKNTVYSLTHAQRRVWFTELLEPGTSICNLVACVKFRGNIDFDVLRRALDFSILQNDSLRFQLTEGDGSEPQLYLAGHRPISLETVDFTHIDQSERDAWIDKQTRVPFKLFHSPLYHFTLLVMSDEEVWLYSKFHHIIMDGISLNLLGNQLIEIYQKIMRSEDLAEHQSPSYLSYMEKEQQYLQSSRFQKDRSFWTETYRTVPEHLSLAERTSHLRQSTAASRDTITLSHSLEQSIRRFCKDHNVSIISLFMASLYICISRLTAKKDIAIGTYYGNRGSKLEKDMLGMFVSTLPIRMTADPDAEFLSFVRSVGKQQLSVMRHQKYPYNLFVNELRQIHHDLQNIIGISMQYQPLAWRQAEGFDYETAMFFSGHTANELSILIKERTDTGLIELNFDYQSALFTKTSIKRIQTHLLTIVENAVRNPNRLIRHIDMADEKEKKRVLTAFNRTETAEPPARRFTGCLPAAPRFRRIVRRSVFRAVC